jgi:hypothetical protein
MITISLSSKNTPNLGGKGNFIDFVDFKPING